VLEPSIVVVGGGVSGLAASIALARQGHRVTVVERDSTPMPETAEQAFEWDRRGAPQVRHSHAFLARLRNLLRDHYPDVLASLMEAGAREISFAEGRPSTITNYEPQADDEELVLIACRRTTFEWVLRRAALAEGGVTFRSGNGVVGLLHDGGRAAAPTVIGVRLDDDSELTADLTIIAGGRRSDAPEWLTAIGAAAVDEKVDDTGIVYFSRFYRLLPGFEWPPRTGTIGGDLGYLKYGVFVGDNDTFSITLAVSTDDDSLRSVLDDADVFDTVARSLMATAPYLDGRAEPITDVHKMAGLLNRWRDYAPDGQPVALGVHVIGDARLCTNPLYGRGCTTSFWHAHLLAESVAAHPGDVAAQAVALDTATRTHLYPWYKASVRADRDSRQVAGRILSGDSDQAADDPAAAMRAIFREGLLPALRTDAHVLRAFFRNFNLLTTPDALLTDPDVMNRVLAVYQDRESRPPEPALGPRRAALVEMIAGAAG
jgi:2-polyprenyl-6-methoxyphenol hydroxylase-like FAD-dependent oxidoreductase